MESGRSCSRSKHFYPRPPRGGRRPLCRRCERRSPYFYPRPPRGGRRASFPILTSFSLFLSTPSARRATAYWATWTKKGVLFLSTPSARRATARWRRPAAMEVISIHALREEGDGYRCCVFGCLCPISIHALREEGDQGVLPLPTRRKYFYPRPPRGGRRVEQTSHAMTIYFYPRPPRGGRLAIRTREFRLILFLSTPSARRATAWEGKPNE